MLKKLKSFFSNLNSAVNTLKSINAQILELNNKIDATKEILTDIHLDHLSNSQNQKNELNRFEFQVYSQNGEDGILNEILKRLNIESGYFVEIGIQDGLETNTTFLLMKGWKGAWIEADQAYLPKINQTFRKEIEDKNLTILNDFVNAENINQILSKENLPSEIDILSIDIDSNDYWVWKNIVVRSPKIIIIEYNAFIPCETEWIMDYHSAKVWDSSTVFNASLKSLEMLGREKGYKLLACCYNGVNAFFVREDLITDKFLPLQIEEIYQPVRYYLKRNFTIKKGFQRFNKK